MLRLTRSIAVILAVVTALASSPLRASVITDDLGDTTRIPLHNGITGAGESLNLTLQNFVDPFTHLPSPITRPDGAPVYTGNVDLGEDPLLSDQLQYQRFHVTGQDTTLSLTYFGVGHASYRSVLGVYWYPAGLDPAAAPLTYLPLFEQNVDAPGKTEQFTIPADSYFGFYLNANALGGSVGLFFSEDFRNIDAPPNWPAADHFLFFNTNRGLIMTLEDMPWHWDGFVGQPGDADYEDMLAGTLTLPNGEPMHHPEPASAALLIGACPLLLRRRR